jgi:hypothetical protein
MIDAAWFGLVRSGSFWPGNERFLSFSFRPGSGCVRVSCCQFVASLGFLASPTSGQRETVQESPFFTSSFLRKGEVST